MHVCNLPQLLVACVIGSTSAIGGFHCCRAGGVCSILPRISEPKP